MTPEPVRKLSIEDVLNWEGEGVVIRSIKEYEEAFGPFGPRTPPAPLTRRERLADRLRSLADRIDS